MKKLLITGSTGFVGKALCESLKNTEFTTNLAYRNSKPLLSKNIGSFKVGEIDSETDWSKVDCGVTTQ